MRSSMGRAKVSWRRWCDHVRGSALSSQFAGRERLVAAVQVDARIEVHDLQDAGLVDVEGPGELAHLGRPAQLVHELVRRGLDLVVDLLDPARLPHEQRIAQVMTQFAVDDRRGVGREAHAAFFIEALRRLDQPQIGDLQQILVGVAGVGEPLQDVVKEVLVAANDLVERRRRAGLGICREKLLVLHRGRQRYLTMFIMLKIGRYIEMTTTPTMAPTPIIRMGSRIDVSALMLALTSSS